MALNIQDNSTLFAGGYYEQGDPHMLKLSFLRQSRQDAVNDANQSGEPAEHRVVVEMEITSLDRVAIAPPAPRRLRPYHNRRHQ